MASFHSDDSTPPAAGDDKSKALTRVLDGLTARQREVLLLIGEGKTGAEIARTLHLARPTVTLHRRRLMQKLGVAEKADLLRMAVQVRLESDRGIPPDMRG